MKAFQFGKDKTMNTLNCDAFSAYVAFNKATNGQTDIKHDNDDDDSVSESCRREASSIAEIEFSQTESTVKKGQ